MNVMHFSVAGSAGADYTILGDTVDRVMNGFNAIGIG